MLPLLLASALAAPVNPWTSPVGQGVVALTPFLYLDSTPAAYPLLYAQYGFTDRAELLVGAGATLGEAMSFDGVELMPRFFFTDAVGLALHATWVPDGGTTVAPELHVYKDWDALSLTVNAGYGPTFTSGGTLTGSAYAMIAPERYLTEHTSLFLEVNPSVDLNDDGGAAVDRLGLELVPGVGTGLHDTHWFAVGLHLPVLPAFSADGIYIGGWYSIAFGGE